MEKSDSLRLIVLESSKEFGNLVDKELQRLNNTKKSYIVPISECRFANGEGKIVINDTIREKDIYILADINNYSCTYDMYGFTNHKGPDEHFMDIVRVISAMKNHGSSVSVIMPLLYSSRQHRRKGRESLDCAMMLQQLERLGVSSIITFDVHDPNVQNAVPCSSFENFYPTNTVLRQFVKNEKIDYKDLLVIAPDTGAMDRARFYADVLKTNIGMCYKRRDLTKIVNGKNPIIAHEYLGAELDGKTAIIVDDMIASGDSILEVAAELKKRNVKDVYLIATFSLFTTGIENFKKAHKDGLFKKVYSTNLTYINDEIRKEEWLECVDCSHQLSEIIDRLNKKESISDLMNGKKELVEAVLAEEAKSV